MNLEKDFRLLQLLCLNRIIRLIRILIFYDLYKYKLASLDELTTFFCILGSAFESKVMLDSSKLSFGGLCEKALTLSEALFSEEEELDGKLLACGMKK